MAWYRCGGGGLPAGLQSDMDTVLNKKFSTSTTYPPTDWPDTVNLMGPLPEKTASGAIANITDGADGVPVKSWLVTLPASLDGYSAIGCTKSGKNLFDKTNPNEVDGYFTTTGFSTLNTNAKTIYIPIKGGTTWTVSKTAGQRFQIATAETIPANNATFTSRQANNTATSLSITASANDKYLWAWVFLDGTDTGTLADMLASIQIEVGSTATAYEAYTAPTTATASLGRTIYGGTADVVNGTGTDGYAKGSMTSTYLSGLSSSYIGYEASLAYFGGHAGVWVRNWNYQTAAARTAGGIGAVCNHFPISFNNSDIFASQYRVYFDVDGKNISSVQDFIDYVSTLEQNNDSLDIVYELATATDFTFTPIPTPETPLGVSNWWADEGDSDVTYRADISLALQALGGGGRGLMMMRPTEPEETEETEETEGLEDELNR